MPTIPLYSSPPHVDAWHRVRSPGGYESWHFDFHDPGREIFLSVDLIQGGPFDILNLHHYSLYRRRPTHHPPPAPADLVEVRVAVSEVRSASRFEFHARSPAHFSASTESPAVSIDACRFLSSEKGIDLEISSTNGISAKLQFCALLRGDSSRRRLLPRKLNSAEHLWITANPVGRVSGMIRCANRESTVDAMGYHDHLVGLAPLAYDLRRMLRARVLFEDAGCALHAALSSDRRSLNEVQMLEFSPAGVGERAINEARLIWPEGVPHPLDLVLDDALRLSNPRGLVALSEVTFVEYDAVWNGRSAKAIVELHESDLSRDVADHSGSRM